MRSPIRALRYPLPPSSRISSASDISKPQVQSIPNPQSTKKKKCGSETDGLEIPGKDRPSQTLRISKRSNMKIAAQLPLPHRALTRLETYRSGGGAGHPTDLKPNPGAGKPPSLSGVLTLAARTHTRRLSTPRAHPGVGGGPPLHPCVWRACQSLAADPLLPRSLLPNCLVLCGAQRRGGGLDDGV